MKNKVWRDPITLFVLRFALIFGLLIFPWPGFNDLYSAYFRSLGETAFTRDEGQRAVVFLPFEAGGPPGLDTCIKLANRDLLDADGRGLMRKTGLDTRSVGWVPTALTIALIAATPIPWRRRIWALVGGLVLVHAFILICLQAWIWNNSPDVSLLQLSPFWKTVVDDLDYTLITQLGASFAIPVLIWIVVTFNSHDVLNRHWHPEKLRA